MAGTRRGFLKAAGAAAAALSIPAALRAAANSARKPNILFIMADDLGYECLRCNGGTSYQTPTLDKLAATGVRFTSAHSTPLCTPTRVQVMTGQYPYRNGWPVGIWTLPRARQVMDPKTPTFAHVLKAAGYATAAAGKWQLARFEDHPDHLSQCGFDEHCMWTWQYGKINPSRYWKPFVWRNGKLRKDLQEKDVFGPDVFTDFLIDFIRRHKDGPWFAYYPMALTHLPLVKTPSNRDTGAKGKALFAGMVGHMDGLVGRLVGALDKLGLRESTLIVFTGDNGTPRQITSKMGEVAVPGGKGTMRETGTHVPLIANWPGTAAKGKVCNDLVDLSDVLPTFAEAARAAIPKGHSVDGRSFLPQVQGKAGSPREWVFLQVGKRKAVRTQEWKLLNDGKLFNMADDPFEKRPLLPGKDTAESAKARKRLGAILGSSSR